MIIFIDALGQSINLSHFKNVHAPLSDIVWLDLLEMKIYFDKLLWVSTCSIRNNGRN